MVILVPNLAVGTRLKNYFRARVLASTGRNLLIVMAMSPESGSDHSFPQMLRVGKFSGRRVGRASTPME